MINLVRNELIKIFSKKAIYVYTALILVLVAGGCIARKKFNSVDDGYSEVYIESLESGLNSYDLKNESELQWYIRDKVIIDSAKISKEYKSDSPERFYIDNVIEPLISEKYQKQYITKDIDAVKALQAQIDEEIKFLKKFDWKKQIVDEKNNVLASIAELETLLLENDDDSIKKSIEALELEEWCLDYRLENEIPYSYKTDSALIESYKELSAQYVNLKDEELIKDEIELLNARTIKADYEVALYKLEHKLYSEEHDTIDYIVMCMSFMDGFIIIALIIISASIVSEEFNKGTIKQLLTKPFSRGKILASKIIACLIVFTLFVLVYQTVFVLANCYETNSLNRFLGTNVVYDYHLGIAKEVSVIGQCLYAFVSTLPAYLTIFMMIIFIGVISTNSIATTVVGFGAFIAGDLMSSWLSPKLVSFIPLCTWNLAPFMYGGMHENVYITFGKSLVIDILFMIMLVVLSFIFFKKKEIKNQ